MWLATKSSDADKWLSRGAHWLKVDMTETERIEMFRQFRYCARMSNDGLPMDMLTGMSATKVVDSMPNPPTIVHDVPSVDDLATYENMGGEDTVHMVPPERLAHHPDWWQFILFHELGHSTEHPTRLGYYPNNPRELLVEVETEIAAEFTAVFLAIQCDMTLYLDATIKFMHKQMGRLKWWSMRPKVLVLAVKLGERQARYILGEVTA